MREATRTAKIAIDTTPPATTATGGGTGWHNHDVTVRLTATDLRSGVAKSEYTLDGGKTWVQNSWLLVAALRNHSNDGLNTVGFRSTDFAGNVETTKTKDRPHRHPATDHGRSLSYERSPQPLRDAPVQRQGPQADVRQGDGDDQDQDPGRTNGEDPQAGTAGGQHEPGLPFPLRARAEHVPLRGSTPPTELATSS